MYVYMSVCTHSSCLTPLPAFSLMATIAVGFVRPIRLFPEKRTFLGMSMSGCALEVNPFYTCTHTHAHTFTHTLIVHVCINPFPYMDIHTYTQLPLLLLAAIPLSLLPLPLLAVLPMWKKLVCYIKGFKSCDFIARACMNRQWVFIKRYVYNNTATGDCMDCK